MNDTKIPVDIPKIAEEIGTTLRSICKNSGFTWSTFQRYVKNGLIPFPDAAGRLDAGVQAIMFNRTNLNEVDLDKKHLPADYMVNKHGCIVYRTQRFHKDKNTTAKPGFWNETEKLTSSGSFRTILNMNEDEDIMNVEKEEIETYPHEYTRFQKRRQYKARQMRIMREIRKNI